MIPTTTNELAPKEDAHHPPASRDDGFEGLSYKFSSLENGDGFGSLDNFSAGRLLCAGAKVADERLGLFEEETICFGFNLVGGLVEIGHGLAFHRGREQK